MLDKSPSRSLNRISLPIALNTLAVDLRLALRNILRQPRRSIIAIVAISFGVVSMMLAAGFIEWVFWANREWPPSTSSATYRSPGQATTRRQGRPLRLSTAGTIPRPGAPGTPTRCTVVAPRLAFNGLISHGESTLSFIGEGIDPNKDPSSAI